MAIQRVDISNMSNADIASLLGLSRNLGYMIKEEDMDVNYGYGFAFNNYSSPYYTSFRYKGGELIKIPINANSNILSYEKTENTCVFGLNSSLSEERLNCGYTLATDFSTGKKVWIYFIISGSTAHLIRGTDKTIHTIKSVLTFEDDEAVSMVNYYIPEFNVFCDYLYSLVVYKNRSDYSYNRFKLNDAYYIKPSANDISVTAPTTRYDCFAVRTG